MPSKVRIISERNEQFDRFIASVIDDGAWGQEREYFGIPDLTRAIFVRKRLKTAGRHMTPAVAVKAYYKPCTQCRYAEPGCQYHVFFTVYDMDKARAYKASRAQ